MILLSNQNPDSIDPAIAYTYPIQQLLIDTNDGLVTWRRASGQAGQQIVPDLATAVPAPTDGGRTWVFHLRRGIRFSNGADVVPADVPYSFERLFKAGSPIDGTFFGDLVGGAACIKRPAHCSLAHGVVANNAAGTVTFHLVTPDPVFLDKVADTFGDVVPVGSPNHDVGTKPLPATGPYMIQSYVPNRQVTFVRNPMFHEWAPAAQPAGNPNTIVLKLGLTPESETTEVERGQADWMYDTPPPDRLAEVEQRYPAQLHLDPVLTTNYLALNVRVAPFNNLDARKAVNYAINRAAIIKLYGGPGLGTPTCQILPPNMLGYAPYCPYTASPSSAGRWAGSDMTKARQLVAASHTAGMPVKLYALNDTNDTATALYLQTVLKQLGYNATVKTLNTNSFVGVAFNSSFHPQAALYAWADDYPAPSDFLYGALSCNAFTPATSASSNLAEFCDPSIDSQMRHALAVQLTNKAAAGPLWASVDRSVTDMAPWAALFNPKLPNFVSSRIGGFQFNPVWYWLIDQSYVK
jgi:peptide/nickel transport system substrate-binding protein